MRLGVHAQDEWDLLSVSVPLIAKCLSHRSKHMVTDPYAILVRADLLVFRLRFLQKVHSQQQFSADDFDNLQDGMRRILSLLEECADDVLLCQPLAEVPGIQHSSIDIPKLRKLRCLVDDHTNSFDQHSIFNLPSIRAKVMNMHTTISGFNETFAAILLNIADVNEAIEPDQLTNVSNNELRQVSEVQILSDKARTLFQGLMEAFEPCANPLGHHEAKISLDGFQQQRWNMLISPCDSSDVWLPLVCSFKSLPKVTSRSSHETRKSSICNDIRMAKNRRESLHLEISETKWWKHPFREEFDFKSQQAMMTSRIPVRNLISSNSTTDESLPQLRLEPSDKKRLAVLLAQSMLYLLDSPWMRGPCHQSLFYLRRPEGPEPFLKCSFEHNEIGLPVELDDSVRNHAYIFHFGIFLTEIECGHLFEANEEDIGYDDNEFSAYLMLKRIQKSQIFGSRVEAKYQDIIQACLDFEYLLKGLYHPSLDDRLRYRAAFLKHIFWPLITELKLRYPNAASGLLEKLETTKDEAKPKTIAVDASQRKERSKNTKQHTDRVSIVSQTQTATTRVLPQRTAAHSPQPSVNNVIQYDTSTRNSFMTLYHDEIMLTRTDEQSAARAREYKALFKSYLSRYCPTSSGTSRVKIAVLDTGIDEDDDTFALLRRHIISRRRKQNSVNDDLDPIRAIEPFIGEDTQDNLGHGTHMATTIMMYAPEANIYIGKIANDTSIDQVEHIAKALTWALDNDVDMISMSFGLSPGVPHETLRPVRQVIRKAYFHNKIMFAAASNCGGNGQRSYPASDHHVFSAHAVDGKGWDTGLNPSIEGYTDRYSTLGVGIQFSWDGKNVFRSGTSFATPIMACIAADVLGYVKNAVTQGKLEARILEFLSDHTGMDKLFSLISSEVGGYRFITPWKIWSPVACDDDIYAKLTYELR